MRAVVSILLCLVFGGLILSISLHKTVVHASFAWNQDYIASHLCIEKDTEGSTCNGHCYLRKQLEQTQEHQQPNFISTPDHLLHLFIENIVVFALPFEHETMANQVVYINPHSLTLPADIFHPPRG